MFSLLFTREWRNNGLKVAVETSGDAILLALRYERDVNISKQNKTKQNKNLFESTREARVLRGDPGFR